MKFPWKGKQLVKTVKSNCKDHKSGRSLELSKDLTDIRPKRTLALNDQERRGHKQIKDTGIPVYFREL